MSEDPGKDPDDNPGSIPPPYGVGDPASPSPDPASPNTLQNGRLEPSPPGISLKVKRDNWTAIGNSYSEQVRLLYGASEAPPTNEEGGLVPDGLFVFEGNNGVRSAIEAKYIDNNWEKSIYNPKDNLKEIISRDTVRQALKYDKEFTGGVRWVTNSPEFVRVYTPRFLKAGVTNFSFTIIPATRE